MQTTSNSTGKLRKRLNFVGAEWRKPGEDAESFADKAA